MGDPEVDKMVSLTIQNSHPEFVASSSGRIGVYLDNDSLISLAKGQESLRRRFVNFIFERGDLLFSSVNALEVAGPQGGSADKVRDFLDSLGPNWVPLELSPFKVLRKEKEGAGPDAAVSQSFLRGYVLERLAEKSQKEICSFDGSFFRLGAVVDWVHQERARLRQQAKHLDAEMKDLLAKARAQYEADPKSLDSIYPPVRFVSDRPGAFVLNHLMRMLVIEAKAYQFKRNDGIDFCHAVLCAGYASVGTLDKQWKRRASNLPEANRLARIFYKPEIDEMVGFLESLLRSQPTATV